MIEGFDAHVCIYFHVVELSWNFSDPLAHNSLSLTKLDRALRTTIEVTRWLHMANSGLEASIGHMHFRCKLHYSKIENPFIGERRLNGINTTISSYAERIAGLGK